MGLVIKPLCNIRVAVQVFNAYIDGPLYHACVCTVLRILCGASGIRPHTILWAFLGRIILPKKIRIGFVCQYTRYKSCVGLKVKRLS